MIENWKDIIPADYNDNSRVWIYQCNRLFFISEALEIEEMLENFTKGWLTHGAKVKGYANLLFGQFIVIMADESQAGVSGCSTDSSVRLIKEMEQRFNVTMFDRMNLAFLIKNKVQVIPMAQLAHALTHDFVNADTLYFNNTVLNKQALLNNWLIPVKDSWLASRLQTKKV